MTLSVTLAALLLVALGRASSAGPIDPDVADQVCSTLEQSSTVSPMALANACEQAALLRKQRADARDGAERQQELIYEATDLFMAAKGELMADNFQVGVNALAKSGEIYRNVHDHAATSGLRQKAQIGITAVTSTVQQLQSMK
jgi:hypothetical protein